jgi:hypothetical protein
VAPIDKLRSLVAALEAAQLPRTDIARWAASAIQRGIDQGGSFEEVFGIGWANRLRARDEMIRQTYDRHFANQTPYVAAGRLERLAKDVTKLRALGRFDQIALDDPRRLVAQAMDIGLPFPKKRQLINVLSLQ